MLTLGCHGSPPYHYNLPNLLLNLNLNIPLLPLSALLRGGILAQMESLQDLTGDPASVADLEE